MPYPGALLGTIPIVEAGVTDQGPEVARRAWIRLIGGSAGSALVVFLVGAILGALTSGIYGQLPASEQLALHIALVAGLGLTAEILSVAVGLVVVQVWGRTCGLDPWHAVATGTASSCLLTLLAIVAVLVV